MRLIAGHVIITWCSYHQYSILNQKSSQLLYHMGRSHDQHIMVKPNLRFLHTDESRIVKKSTLSLCLYCQIEIWSLEYKTPYLGNSRLVLEPFGQDELPKCGGIKPHPSWALSIPRTGRCKCASVATRGLHGIVATWTRAQLAGDLDTTAAKMTPMFGLGQIAVMITEVKTVSGRI